MHNTFIDIKGNTLYRGEIGWFSDKELAKTFGWCDNGIILDSRIPKTTQKIEPKQLTLF